MSKAALEHARNNQTHYLDTLKTFLTIPSISTQSEHAPDMQKAAEWLVETMTASGLSRTAIYSTPGPPIAYGEWLGAGPEAPTVLVYGHYDVQPPDPLDKWVSPPFEPTVRGDNLFGRGTTDDKGQLFVHLAAVDAIMKTEGKLPVNVKFIFEGEEEIGSMNLDAFIAENADLLAADCAVISDSPFIEPEQPSLIYGLRGLVLAELEVRSAKRDLHSGQYGGVIHNPLVALANIIAAMHDENYKVTIPEFYDDVLPLDEEEKALLAQLPNTLLAETGARKLWGEPGLTPLERINTRPTFEVHGIVGGYTDEGMKTVIPAGATAKVSMRLVPNQDPHKTFQQLAKYVKSLAPETIDLEVKLHSLSYPALINRHDPAMMAASKAYELGFQRRPLFTREGGSIGAVIMLQQYLGVPIAMMGFGLVNDNLHAPNEKFYLPNFYRGIETSIHFFYEYARLK
jgi:acetylornithine deacetylase/succinyl-diaminopimelate desuccinylase-like protein